MLWDVRLATPPPQFSRKLRPVPPAGAHNTECRSPHPLARSTARRCKHHSNSGRPDGCGAPAWRRRGTNARTQHNARRFAKARAQRYSAPQPGKGHKHAPRQTRHQKWPNTDHGNKRERARETAGPQWATGRGRASPARTPPNPTGLIDLVPRPSAGPRLAQGVARGPPTKALGVQYHR
jgi:hypothetical protein